MAAYVVRAVGGGWRPTCDVCGWSGKVRPETPKGKRSAQSTVRRHVRSFRHVSRAWDAGRPPV